MRMVSRSYIGVGVVDAAVVVVVGGVDGGWCCRWCCGLCYCCWCLFVWSVGWCMLRVAFSVSLWVNSSASLLDVYSNRDPTWDKPDNGRGYCFLNVFLSELLLSCSRGCLSEKKPFGWGCFPARYVAGMPGCSSDLYMVSSVWGFGRGKGAATMKEPQTTTPAYQRRGVVVPMLCRTPSGFRKAC